LSREPEPETLYQRPNEWDHSSDHSSFEEEQGEAVGIEAAEEEENDGSSHTQGTAHELGCESGSNWRREEERTGD
jgi:hypothetical protein